MNEPLVWHQSPGFLGATLHLMFIESFTSPCWIVVYSVQLHPLSLEHIQVTSVMTHTRCLQTRDFHRSLIWYVRVHLCYRRAHYRNSLCTKGLLRPRSSISHSISVYFSASYWPQGWTSVYSYFSPELHYSLDSALLTREHFQSTFWHHFVFFRKNVTSASSCSNFCRYKFCCHSLKLISWVIGNLPKNHVVPSREGFMVLWWPISDWLFVSSWNYLIITRQAAAPSDLSPRFVQLGLFPFPYFSHLPPYFWIAICSYSYWLFPS